MDIELITQLKKSFELLNNQLEITLSKIKTIESNIKELLEMPVSEKRTNLLNEYFKYNKFLLAGYKEMNNLKHSVFQYLAKFGNESSGLQTPPPVSFEECFEKTVSKELVYDSKHPYYGDENFKNQVLEYFQNVEDYEMCAHIVKS